jgi:ankyrin repeat protein
MESSGPVYPDFCSQSDRDCIDDMRNKRGSPRHRLYYACLAGDLEEARRLIVEEGVDVNEAKSKTRHSFRIALHAAAAGGHEDICRLLLQHGAIVDPMDENRCTPLWLACVKDPSQRHFRVVRLLLENGAEVDRPNGNDKTPFHTACQKGNIAAAKLCLYNGADAHRVDSKGWTPLLDALALKKGACVEFLLALTIRRHVFGSRYEYPERQIRDVVPHIASFLVPRPPGKLRIPKRKRYLKDVV